MKYDQTHNEIVLEKGGETFYVRVGNTVLDVMYGYPHHREEPCAVVSLYPYDRNKEMRFLVSDQNVIRLSHANGQTDVVNA